MSEPAYNINFDSLPVPEGVHITNELAVVMATAMAVGAYLIYPLTAITNIDSGHTLGAATSDVIQTSRMMDSPSGGYEVTRTKISFTFYNPCADSPYRPPPGATLEDTTRSLLSGEWPLDSSAHGPTPANSPRPTSPISISTGSTMSRSPSPHAVVVEIPTERMFRLGHPTYAANGRALDHIPPADRWYMVTRGRSVGVIQGA